MLFPKLGRSLKTAIGFAILWTVALMVTAWFTLVAGAVHDGLHWNVPLERWNPNLRHDNLNTDVELASFALIVTLAVGLFLGALYVFLIEFAKLPETRPARWAAMSFSFVVVQIAILISFLYAMIGPEGLSALPYLMDTAAVLPFCLSYFIPTLLVIGWFLGGPEGVREHRGRKRIGQWVLAVAAVSALVFAFLPSRRWADGLWVYVPPSRKFFTDKGHLAMDGAVLAGNGTGTVSVHGLPEFEVRWTEDHNRIRIYRVTAGGSLLFVTSGTLAPNAERLRLQAKRDGPPVDLIRLDLGA